MLNKTALINPAFLAKVGRAMREAVTASAGAMGIGIAGAYNRHGAQSLRVVHRRGRLSGFEFFDAAGRDVTGQVIGALRRHGAPESAQ